MSIHMLSGAGVDCNIFLVTGDDPILVDTGTGGNLDAVLEGIAKHIEPKRINRIVLTHRHFDHVGGAGALKEALGARVFIHELDASPLRDGDGWGTLARVFGAPGEVVEVATLKEGDELETGSHRFVVKHTPGHTVGSICLYEKETATLISGDTVFADGVGRWDLPTGDLRQLVDSLQKLNRLEVINLYPGHGPANLGQARRSLETAQTYVGEN